MLRAEARVSPKEMQRRHALLREKMEQAGLTLLLVSGVRFMSGSGYLRYLSNWAEHFSGESMLFPLKGEPVFFSRTRERANLVESSVGMKATVGSTADVVASHIRNMGPQKMGICGLKSMMADFYVQLTKELPGVDLKDCSHVLDEVRMVKSEEEVAWVRRSASLGDSAFTFFSSLVEEGREECELFVEVDHLVKRLGAESTYYMMAADPKPVAKFPDLAYERYKKGDLILFNAEIVGPGGYWSQTVRSLSVGKPSAEATKAADACLESLEAAEKILSPGTSTNQLYKALRDSIERSGHYLVHDPGHSQGLDSFERPFINGKDDVALQEGMVVILHPNLQMPSGGGIWIGDTYIITATGYERLTRSERKLVVL